MTCDKEKTRGIRPGDIAVVVGTGRSGVAAARLLHAKGARVRVLERDAANVPATFAEWAAGAGVEIVCGAHDAAHFADAAVVVPSPGVAVATLRPYLPATGGPEVMAEMELAWRELSGEPVIAVTGTSGKTTTVSLCAHMLRTQGLSVFLGGNIGTPLCEYVLEGKRADVLVIEISSFQLQTCSTFRPRVAMLLNITANHLDYHADMQEYIDAKFRLFRCQDEDDLAVFGEGLAPLVDRYGVKARRVTFRATDRFAESRLFGVHNRANAEAAWTAAREFGVTLENALQAVATFAPMPHRLEQVAERGGVLYVNDSKCTTVSALRVALEAFDRPVLLLAGGKFKGGDLEGLIPLVRERVRAVMLFGASREVFEAAWRDVVPMTWDATLEEAVRRAASAARQGEVVLMAPATASFDLFRNYGHRGDVFRAAVESLA